MHRSKIQNRISECKKAKLPLCLNRQDIVEGVVDLSTRWK
jgi:hypothetical protein